VAQGTIVGGPTDQGGYTWWNVNYDSGADGWSIENFLTGSTGGPTPTPTPTPTASQLSCNNIGTNAFRACYYNDIDLTNLVLTRTDTSVNFDWGSSSPDPLVNSDNFSVRWQGVFSFNQGDYNFAVTVDDGVRLYVDGVLIIDKWFIQAPANYSARIQCNIK
jgi:hypothetical protein